MDADRIMRDVVARLDRTVAEDDAEGYAALLHTPFEFVSARAALRLMSAAELVEGFEAFQEMLRSYGQVRYWREIEAIRRTGPDGTQIEADLVTHIEAADGPVHPPYRTRMVLRRVEGEWKAVRLDTTLDIARWPAISPAFRPPKSATGT